MSIPLSRSIESSPSGYGGALIGGATLSSRPDRSAPPTDVTLLLLRWRDGDRDAVNHLMPLVYGELRKVARKHMGVEGANTLQATALVHEAYLRLSRMDVAWNGRVHFFAVAAGAMRRILVDRARRRKADKRWGGCSQVELGEAAEVARPNGMEPDEVLALDQALKELARLDTRKARILELRLFAGLTIEETADATNASTATVERDLRLARAWVARRLRGLDH